MTKLPGYDTSNPDFENIPGLAAVYCDHCNWSGPKPADDECPACKAWGRIHERYTFAERGKQ